MPAAIRLIFTWTLCHLSHDLTEDLVTKLYALDGIHDDVLDGDVDLLGSEVTSHKLTQVLEAVRKNERNERMKSRKFLEKHIHECDPVLAELLNVLKINVS